MNVAADIRTFPQRGRLTREAPTPRQAAAGTGVVGPAGLANPRMEFLAEQRIAVSKAG